MKKDLLTIGIIFLIAAVISLAVSLFFHWSHGAVLDGSAELYSTLSRRYHTFLYIGIGLLVPGVVLLVISLIMQAK